MKTTRVLAEVDDETIGTESYYMNDSSDGLRDKLLSDYVSGNTEHRLRSGSQLLTDAGGDNKTVDDDIPNDDAGILIVCTCILSSSRWISMGVVVSVYG